VGLQALAVGVAQRAAELAHLVLEDLRGGRRRPLTPQGVDQPLARDGLVAMEKEIDQHAPLPAPSQGHIAGVVADLERP
jgi:hypothetical protein